MKERTGLAAKTRAHGPLAGVSPLVWIILAVQPPLSLAYLWSMRVRWLEPSFWAPIALAALPVMAAGGVIAAWRKADGSRSRVAIAVALLLAAAEVGWSVLVAAMVGFTIALRSG